uniref:Serine/threonine-protein kinase TOR n=1 Tax=Brachionus rotundiformis TaxID=96890 RepID=A0A2Z4EUI2_9BILA|nr:serine/threonine-protein kinase mTOR [Brachionus rotundiformis]
MNKSLVQSVLKDTNFKQGLADINYSQYIDSLKSQDHRVQLKAAKDFYAFLLNELKQVKRDAETSFVDNLIPSIRELANENNQYLNEKKACIYIITSIINLDNINVKVRKKHQTSLFRWLRNLLSCSDQTVIHMASRAMGRYVQAGVECDVEFKSGLEYLRNENESKRYQGILLVRELSLAYHPRLFLNSSTFFENIIVPICDHNPQIRFESIELFRLGLIICLNRESSIQIPNSYINNSANHTSRSNRMRRSSTSSSLSSSVSVADNFCQHKNINLEDNSLSKFTSCIEETLYELESLLREPGSRHSRNSSQDQLQSTRDDKIHGYLQIILEIFKFSNFEFEKIIENYLSTYNLYYQQIQQAYNFNTSNVASLVNLIENTAKSCEEMHVLNLQKLLPHSCFDPLHTNDPFLFLFKSEKINVSAEFKTCKDLIANNYNRINEILINLMKYILNISNLNTNGIINNQSQPAQITYRAIIETILSIIPRYARFDPFKFNSKILSHVLSFINDLNSITNFFISTSSSSSLNSSPQISTNSISTGFFSPIVNVARGAQTKQISSSVIPSNYTNNTLISSKGSYCLGTLKSEIIFCVGFMSLSLTNSSQDFLIFSQQFIHSFRNSSLLKTREIQKKKLILEKEAQINELNSVMACIAMYAYNCMLHMRTLENKSLKQDFWSKIIDLIMNLLEPLMLCSGGITYTMRYFLNEIATHIPELKASIHENLLKILSQILTGRQLSHILKTIPISATHLSQSNNLYALVTPSQIQINGSVIPNRNLNRDQSIQDSLLIQNDVESIVQALQTLRAFEFSSIYIIVFLRYCVDFYLQHESRLVKIESVLTTATLLSRLIDALNSQDSRSLISIISCALRKLLISSITDYEPDVRYHVLNSLDNDSKFNMFVSLPENLNILFMCIRDEKAELRELSASMISRLSASNSAYILPFIRKILTQLITEVDIYSDIGQKEKSVRLIGHLLSHAPRLVNLYAKKLLDVLNAKLGEYRHDVPFASSIVTVVGQLASQSGAETIQHFDTVIPFLIESMQDFYYIQLKHTSLWTLGQIIGNTGYVIEPYKKYSNLLDILMGFLQTETSIQIRHETIRILGLLGAIDPFEYKKTLLKSKQEDLALAASTAAKEQHQMLLTSKNNNQDNDVNVLVYLPPGQTAAAQAEAIAANLNSAEQTSLDPIEMLISMNANGSLEEYYPALAIHLMMKTIKNSVSIGVRKDAIQALVFAMRTLDTRCVNYVELVIPPFLELIKTMNDNLVIDLIVQFGFLVSYIRKHIEPYLGRIFNTIEYYWNQEGDKHLKMVVALIDLVQSIANVMDVEFKKYLPQILPLILKQLQKEIIDYSFTNTSKLLDLLRSLTCCLEDYVHLILNQLSQFADSLNCKDSTQRVIKTDFMFTIYTFAKQINLCDNSAILFQSFRKILEESSNDLPMPNNTILANNPLLTQNISNLSPPSCSQNSGQFDSYLTTPPILSITFLLFTNSNNGANSLTNERISRSTDIGVITLETLYLLARQMNGNFLVFSHMFDRILIKNKSYSKLYEQLMTNCREASFHQFWATYNQTQTNQPLTQTNQQVQSSVVSNVDNSSATNTASRQNQQVSFGNLKVCIDGANQLTTKEGWRESFRKFMGSVVQETPVSTLRACSLIPYETVPPELFNACFISIWVKLTEKEQNDIIKYLELALKNSFVPETIKIILNLAEFIERCDVGYFLPLDYRLLSEKAFQVKAYAKALHYVEEQFHFVMSSPINTANLNGLYNGVGGVSGAGGMANLTSKNMQNLMAASSSQQNQQTLIYLLEQLVSLNHELQRTEAATGVLDFASKYLQNLNTQSNVKERWYEKLHQWQKALGIYEQELKNQHFKPSIGFQITEPNKLNEAILELLMGRMRCLNGLGEWNILNQSCNNLLQTLNQIDSNQSLSTSVSQIDSLSGISRTINLASQSRVTDLSFNTLQLNISDLNSLKEKISEMGAEACWGLGDWEQMKIYTKNLSDTTYEGSLYRSVIALTDNTTDFDYKKLQANSLIKKTRELLDTDLTSMATQSYERSYPGIIEAQVLTELEEIIQYQSMPNKRDWLVETWWKRLQGCERSMEYWHRLLLVRSIVLPKEKCIRPWLKFSSLCQKNGHLKLSEQILDSIHKDDQFSNQENQNLSNFQRDLYFCKYAYLKFLYANNKKREAYTKLEKFVTENLLDQLNMFQLYQQQHQQIQMTPTNTNQTLPSYFQLFNPREVNRKKNELQIQLAKCYLKLGRWKYELDGFTEQTIPDIITYYKIAKEYNQNSYKTWQAWAYANYEALQFYKSNGTINDEQKNIFVKRAIKGFFKCINLCSNVDNFETNSLQDTLRLLTLWFDYCKSQDIYEVLDEGIKDTPKEIWLQVIPQLIARIDTTKQYVAKLIYKLLIDFGRVHPQALVYRLILASKCNNKINNYHASYMDFNNSSRNVASNILQSLKEHNNILVEQAKLVSEELIRMAILWHEMWYESLEEASKLHYNEKNTQGMLDILGALHTMMEKGASTSKETAFIQTYGRDLMEAKNHCDRYKISKKSIDIDQAWDRYYAVFKRITKQMNQMTSLELSYVSPKLMTSRDLELAVPGTYEPNKPIIRIRAFNANIQVITSKQRPRKISMFGSNGCEYVFLLKGHEDLRQDERVMQIFGLVNNLLLKNSETARRDLAIQRYSVIPLSQNSGLLEWLLNCDTLHSLIREYRDKKKISLNLEHKIITKYAPDYDRLTSIQKVQIFEMAIEMTWGNDLAEILWHKSLTAEKWLERRTNFTRSLAVMSMVGYVLGLGDRHPSNLMLDRTNGKIIHIDFGDCFETAMTREKFPEKIPFRLTRMLKNAMEVTGIEGTFRRTCESVMKVLRINRDSLMAVLEAFVYDPLVYWRLVEAANNQNVPNTSTSSISDQTLTKSINKTEVEETNRKAIMVLNRVKDKLTGKDFGDTDPIDEITQVDLLIKQATSSENLCQCFIGWCAWW